MILLFLIVFVVEHAESGGILLARDGAGCDDPVVGPAALARVVCLCAGVRPSWVKRVWVSKVGLFVLERMGGMNLAVCACMLNEAGSYLRFETSAVMEAAEEKRDEAVGRDRSAQTCGEETTPVRSKRNREWNK